MNMKKRYHSTVGKIILIAILLMASSWSISAIAQTKHQPTLTMVYSFDHPTIQQVTVDDTIYDRVIIPGLSSSGIQGEPRLPSQGTTILLPQGATVTDITVTSTEYYLGDRYTIEPITEMQRLSSTQDSSTQVTPPDHSSSDTVFPGELYEQVGIYEFRGYRLLVLKITPVQYLPSTGELWFHTDITLTVTTSSPGQPSPLYRNLNTDRNELLSRIDNSAKLDTYHGPQSLDTYDLLIITTEELAAGFEPLKAAHDLTGIDTMIATTTDIGSANPDEIRNYITSAYSDMGIEYVLIGGDDDVIPAKDLFVRTIWWWPWSETEENMPSDIYFGCLDVTYNYDGDGYWGEPSDGPGGGDVDLVAEVYVGRAPVGTIEEVNSFVTKTIRYMFADDPYLSDAVMAGELLNNDPLTYGGDYMNEIIDGSSANGYSTTGVPTSTYTIDRLYDKDGAWPKSDLISRIETGQHLINHLGHANYDYVMKMSSSDVYSLTNTLPCFVYSQGCMAGGFDTGDCIAEYFTVKSDHAAFAVIMNARYGWYHPGGTDSSSQHFHREYWDAVFAEGKTTIGHANHDSKEDNLYRINEECMRWCYYQLNLLGDPCIDFLDHVEVDPVYLVGLISNYQEYGDISTFDATAVLKITFSPLNINLISSGQTYLITPDYKGYMGENFVFGEFNIASI